MSLKLSLAQVRDLRLRNQCLAEATRLPSAASVVHRLFALQAQEWNSAQLAIHARGHNVTQADVARAREIERAFALSWSLRGTLHLVAAEDLRAQLALCGPPAIRATRKRYEQLGLTERVREKALEEIDDILRDAGALSRARLAEALGARGIPVAGQAIHHLVRFAALRGLVCLGPEVDGALTYVLLDLWLPAQSAGESEADLLRRFARRYLAAAGPAALADFKRWSGLGMKQARAAWAAVESDCVKVALPDGAALLLAEQLETPRAEPSLRLLPRYDNTLLSHVSRRFLVDDAYAKRVHPGGGLIRACLLVDGVARANWKLEKRRAGVRVVVEPFETLEPRVLPPLAAEVESLGRFLNTKADLRVEGG